MEYGEKLPSERQLCQMYSISRTTVRHTIARLEVDGYVQRVHGKGTFTSIITKKRENLTNYYSFTDRTLQLNKIPKSKILEFDVEQITDKLSYNMGLNKGDLVIRFVRLRLADDEPMMLETTFIPYERFKEIDKALLEKKALYDIFEENYKISISSADEQVSAVNLPTYQAKLLNSLPNSACFKLYRLSYDTEDNIIEHTVTFVRSDKFIYKTVYNIVEGRGKK